MCCQAWGVSHKPEGFFFFYQGFLHRHWRFTGLPLPPTHEHWDIYLQLSMWDDYHVFLIATLVFTWQLLYKIYHVIELPFEWLNDDTIMFVCLLDELILGFCYSDLTLETGGFELASTITLVLQANRLPKSASHPKPEGLGPSLLTLNKRKFSEPERFRKWPLAIKRRSVQETSQIFLIFIIHHPKYWFFIILHNDYWNLQLETSFFKPVPQNFTQYIRLD